MLRTSRQGAAGKAQARRLAGVRPAHPALPSDAAALASGDGSLVAAAAGDGGAPDQVGGVGAPW